MKRLVIAAAAVMIGSLPVAGQAQELPATAEEMGVSVNWGNLQSAVMAMVQASRKTAAENTALRKHVADMDAYLKACGDKPGCSVPVEK